MEDHQQNQQQLKHVCKLCCRGFPCGRSLGGHMRSHGIMNSASDTTDAIKFRERNLSSLPVSMMKRHNKVIGPGTRKNLRTFHVHDYPMNKVIIVVH